MTLPDPPSSGTVSCILATHEFAPFQGGVATYVQEIASGALRAGIKVEVWTVKSRASGEGVWETDLPPESMAGCPVVRLPSSGRLTPAGILALAWGFAARRRQWHAKPVILLSVGAQMAFFLLHAVGLAAPAHVTCFFHGSEILRFNANPFWRRLAKRFYSRAAGFAVNSFHVEHLLRSSGLVPEDVTIVRAPCACPCWCSRLASEERDGSPAEWRVLTVGRLHPRKGQLEVARALGMLPAELRGRVIYQMVGVGKQSYRDEIEAACREGVVRYEFLGALNDVQLSRAYSAATLYVQASQTLPQSVEGFGISFLEASFYGAAIVAVRSGGVDEAVRDGETGILVAEGDLQAFADAIGCLLRDETTRDHLGAAGRVWAQTFSWEKSARILYDAATTGHGDLSENP